MLLDITRSLFEFVKELRKAVNPTQESLLNDQVLHIDHCIMHNVSKCNTF